MNLGLLYTHPRGNTELGLFMNARGDHVEAAGGSGVPDIYQKSRTQWDFSVRQALVGGTSMKFKVNNLFDSKYLFEQEANGITLLQREYRVGTSYSLGLALDM